MSFSWTDKNEIAALLQQRFPQADLANLDHSDLIEMVRALPDFKDESKPDPDDLEAIIDRWIDLEFDEEPERVPSSEI